MITICYCSQNYRSTQQSYWYGLGLADLVWAHWSICIIWYGNQRMASLWCPWQGWSGWLGPLFIGFFSFKKSAWLCMEVTRFQENKGEQVTSLKAQTQTSPITSFSLLWPKQVKKPIQMTGIKKLTPHLKGRRNKNLWPITQNYSQGLTVERAKVSIWKQNDLHSSCDTLSYTGRI